MSDRRNLSPEAAALLASAEANLRPRNFRELFSRGPVQQEWSIWPFLPKGRTVALYGPAKAGKSTALLSAIVDACLGRQPYGNNEVKQESVKVLYLDWEMSDDDLQERLETLGCSIEECDTLSENLHYVQFPGLPPLDTASGGLELLTYCLAHNINAVVVDVIARAVQGDENDAATIGNFYKHTAARLKANGISVLRVDHAGKKLGNGARGSSSKNDDVDIVYSISRRQGSNVRTIQRDLTRINWAPEKVIVDLVELSDGSMRLQLKKSSSADRTVNFAGIEALVSRLDELGIALTATYQEAYDGLVEGDGKGRRKRDILAALKYRRDRDLAAVRPDEEQHDIPLGGGYSNGHSESSTDPAF